MTALVTYFLLWSPPIVQTRSDAKLDEPWPSYCQTKFFFRSEKSARPIRTKSLFGATREPPNTDPENATVSSSCPVCRSQTFSVGLEYRMSRKPSPEMARSPKPDSP